MPDNKGPSGDGELNEKSSSPSTGILFRPRAGSLQSRSGRDIGKLHAHFADELVNSTTTTSAGTSENASLMENANVSGSSQRNAYSQLLSPPTSSEASGQPSSSTGNSSSDLTEMRNRQSAILEKRRRDLRDRLANVERSSQVASSVNNAGAFGVTDPERLERMIQTLKQIVLLIAVCLMIIVLRRVILVVEEEDFSDF